MVKNCHQGCTQKGFWTFLATSCKATKGKRNLPIHKSDSCYLRATNFSNSNTFPKNRICIMHHCLMNHNLACTGSNQTQDTDKTFCFDNRNISIIFKTIQRNYHTFLVFSSKTSCLNLLWITKLEIKFSKITLF